MKALVFTLLIGLALPALAGPAVHVDSDLPLPPPTRFPLVCQEPMEIGLRASSGTFSEVADDIPQDLVGLEFDTVVLYLAEWLAPWQDPDGITLNFYDALCPPAMDPVMTLYTPWSEIEAVFQGATSSMIMYKVTLSLDSAIEILPAMSIGAQVETSWGTAMPSAGFLGSGWVNGCGELYWDDYYGGIPRWTPASQTAAGNHPEREIDRVTTPRGCTIAGLNRMEHDGFSSAMIRGITVSAEMAAGLYRKDAR